MFDFFDLIDLRDSRIYRNKWLFYPLLYALSCLSAFALRWEPFWAVGLIPPVFYAVYFWFEKRNEDSFWWLLLGIILGAVAGLIVALCVLSLYYLIVTR